MPDQSILNGQFELINETKRDSLHRVYRGRSLEKREEVDVVMLTEEAASDPQCSRNFRDLHEALRNVEHANVVRVLATGSQPVPYAVLTPTRGIALERVLATRKLDVDVACEVGLQVLAGLAAAQEYHVSHRCLLPGNVFVDLDSPQGIKVQVAQFGLLHTLLGENTCYSLSRYDQRFVAPEVLDGSFGDPRSDLYSVGMLLYEMLSRASYRGGDGMWLRPSGDLAELIRRNPTVPEPLVRSVASALAPAQSGRLRSAAELARLLVPYVKPRVLQEKHTRVNTLDPLLRDNADSDVPPSVLLNRAPKPRSDSACPEAMLIDPTFPRSPSAPKLEALHADAYGRRRPPANMELEIVEHAKVEPDAIQAHADSLERNAAAANGFGVGAAMAWLGKLL